MIDRFVRVIDWISETSGRMVAWLILPLIVTIVYSVAVRYLYRDVVHWAFEMSLFMFGVMVMLGGAHTLKHKSHVRVDVLATYLGPRMRLVLDLISFAVIVGVCVLITWMGTRSAYFSTLRLERSPLQTPFNPQIWWYRWAIPLSATLIGLQALAEMVKSVRDYRNERDGTGGAPGAGTEGAFVGPKPGETTRGAV